jgi:hypothetical protein
MLNVIFIFCETIWIQSFTIRPKNDRNRNIWSQMGDFIMRGFNNLRGAVAERDKGPI